MRVPLSWIKQYVKIEDSVEGISKHLTRAGMEVEAIHRTGEVLDQVIVAEVTSVKPHPNADKLRCCTVFDGQATLEVVCGAPNVREGLKAPFAPVGANLGDGFIIKEATLRGEKSFGMLCGCDEIGLAGDPSGIMELSEDLPTGSLMSDHFGKPETVFELEITPNRPDCLSMIGIARELAAQYQTTLTYPEVSPAPTSAASSFDVSVKSPDACKRYSAHIMEGLSIKPSPTWMQRHLEHAGIRPINNVVDITNYVLLEYGQPLHAFDLDKLNSHSIVVRQANDGEPLRTLDGQNRTLNKDMLVIATPDRPVALAGIMGGEDTEIGEKTSRILLESAWFSPQVVRPTAQALDAHSESSYRFARGVDVENVLVAARRAVDLLVAYADAKPVSGYEDFFPVSREPVAIRCRWERARKLIGVELAPSEITSLLESIELRVLDQDDVGFEVLIPSFRSDLTREVDIIEEIARLHGLENIPAPPPKASLVPGADDSLYRATRNLRNQLVGLGLNEILNYSLTSAALLDELDAENKAHRIVLPRPISTDQSVLRTSLLPQMVETLARNKAHQEQEAAFFEYGRTFLLHDGSPEEKTSLSIGLMGPVALSALDKRKKVSQELQFRALKGIVEDVCKAAGLVRLRFKPTSRKAFSTCVALFAGKTCLGVLGILAEKPASKRRIFDPVALAELEVAPLLQPSTLKLDRVALSAYPASSRDMAFVVADTVQHQQLRSCIVENTSSMLEEVTLFDVYQGKPLDKGLKSMAFMFRFRSSERTLTDEEIDAEMDRVAQALAKKFDAVVREF